MGGERKMRSLHTPNYNCKIYNTAILEGLIQREKCQAHDHTCNRLGQRQKSRGLGGGVKASLGRRHMVELSRQAGHTTGHTCHCHYLCNWQNLHFEGQEGQQSSQLPPRGTRVTAHWPRDAHESSKRHTWRQPPTMKTC